MAAKAPPLPKNLTELIKSIGSLTHTVDNDGAPVSKDEQLVRLIWDLALGYEEVTVDDKGNQKTVKHKPQKWAIQEIYSRREGGIPQAMTVVDKNRISAAKQVRELAKNRLNAIAERAQAKADKPDGE